jgi:plastocyanin
MKKSKARRQIVICALVTASVTLLTVRSSSAGEVIQVKIKDLAFSPAHVIAHVDDAIEWVNVDFLVHTVTARDGEWDLEIPANAIRRIVIKHPGTIAYYCRFHPNMVGEIEAAQ